MDGWINHLIVRDRQSNGCIAGAGPVTPGSFEFCCLLMFGTTLSRIIGCDSENCSTHFLFSASSFFHLSYAVSQALLATSHPLPGGSAAPTACDLIQNHYCTPHLTEVYSQPPPRTAETHPGLLGKLTITQHWLVIFFLLQSRGTSVQTESTFFTFDTKPS